MVHLRAYFANSGQRHPSIAVAVDPAHRTQDPKLVLEHSDKIQPSLPFLPWMLCTNSCHEVGLPINDEEVKQDTLNLGGMRYASQGPYLGIQPDELILSF